jgi:hypothetical protein
LGAVLLLAGCTALREGTGAVPAGIAPLLRIAPADVHGSVFVNGLALRPSGERALLLYGKGALALDDAAQPASATSPTLALFTPSGAPRIIALPAADHCSPLARGPDGTIAVACSGQLTEAERTTAGRGQHGLALLLTVLGPDSTTPESARIVVPELDRLGAFALAGNGSLLLAGGRNTPDVLLLRLRRSGAVVARGRLPNAAGSRARLVVLADGDVVVGAERPRTTAGQTGRNPMRMARFAAADLSLRWKQTLAGVAPFPELAVDAAGRVLYVAANIGAQEAARSHPGLFALRLDDGAVLWRRAFRGPGHNGVDTIAALPGGGLVAMFSLQAESAPARSTDDAPQPATPCGGPYPSEPPEVATARLEVGGREVCNRHFADRDAVLVWLDGNGTVRRSAHWEADSRGCSASVDHHIAFDGDGRMVVAGNFFGAAHIAGRWIHGPSRLKPCRYDAWRRTATCACSGADCHWHPPPPSCTEPRRINASTAFIATLAP